MTDVVWSSSNEAVATVDQDGVVSAVGAGEATITVSDPTQPSVSASVAVRVSAAGPASQAGSWRWDVHGWWYRYEDGSYPSDTTLVLDGATYRFDASGACGTTIMRPVPRPRGGCLMACTGTTWIRTPGPW